jgi:hypothetical protein
MASELKVQLQQAAVHYAGRRWPRNKLYAHPPATSTKQTSEVYADHGSFTANPELTGEVGSRCSATSHDRLDKTGSSICWWRLDSEKLGSPSSTAK